MPFPPGFLFGTANADHQVEAHDPAREDVWDVWERCQGLTPRGRGTDFWNRYVEDITAAARMGCRLFRFSIAWARVETVAGVFDAEALAHYRRVAECVKAHGMQVMVTLHHFVWPVWLERDHGGMIGEKFPDLFARYAAQVADALGDLVDWWISFNEPSQLTFGYIRPWWHNRYYMPPGLPRGTEVDAEAEAVGRLIPNLFRAHARARREIKARKADAKVGVNPLVTGFPTWLQMLMDFGACHRRLQEAVFKFTTGGALVSERGDVDLVIGGVTEGDQTRFEFSDPYLRTGKAVLVRAEYAGTEIAELKEVAVIAVGNQPDGWKRDLPPQALKKVFANYDEARSALEAGKVEAVYGDAFFLLPFELKGRERFRFLATGLSDEHYVVVAPHGHHRLLERVNRAVAVFQHDLAGACEVPWISQPEVVAKEVHRPLSLHEVFAGEDSLPESMSGSRGMRRIRRRGKIRIGIRTDAPGVSNACEAEGLELRLARLIAREVLGDESRLEIEKLEPCERFEVLESKSSWLNWAWRFWGTTSLIANVNWWYLGTSGRLPEELCPEEAVGAQDFVGLDYYWGLPTWRLHRFRLLEEAAHGRFLRAPVWPQGLFHALQRFHRWFPEQEILIVENGCVPSADGMTRTDYIKAHLAQVERALKKGVPVKAYNYWSITSNREWGHAFDPNTDFGLYFVDLDKDGELKRRETSEVGLLRDLIGKANVE
ncbi:family 1 glycosylhydrolase [Haloferula sp. BvORR071]|uniref:family 1 glycosylhydrolase n=1 Tax=Haloferula sp. BvORR071 TaxID=1396141 RepID=UPI000558EC5C|nr:family 1 glycosylhydrolase [Haloferula sp. BvORR071]